MNGSAPDPNFPWQTLISLRIDVLSLDDLKLPEDAFRSRYGLPSSDSCLVARMAMRSPIDGQPATLAIVTKKLKVNTKGKLGILEQQNANTLLKLTHKVALSVFTKALLQVLCNSDVIPLHTLASQAQQQTMLEVIRKKELLRPILLEA